MFEAQLLIAQGTGEQNEYRVFSPWFPRQGDNVTFTVETVKQVGEPVLKVHFFTKNSEDPGSGSDPDGTKFLTASSSAGGKDADTWVGEAKELVRYQFEITGDAGDWVLFRMLPPVWFDSVNG